MGIVDIQPNRAKEILDTHVVGIDAVDEIFIPPTYNNLDEKTSGEIRSFEQQ